jgi:hypothetical protein
MKPLGQENSIVAFANAFKHVLHEFALFDFFSILS